MKKLIWKIVLPLTLIVFSTISMWRFVLIVDGPSEILTGFPLLYICSGWHTSLSYQIFISEFVIDFFIYFVFCFLIVFFVDRFIWKIRTRRKTVVIFYVIALFLSVNPFFLLGLDDHVYKMKRDFNTKTLEKGFKLWHSVVEKPDLGKYVLIQEDYIKQLDCSWDSLIDKDNFQIKYVKQVDNPYLGFSPTRRIEDVNFIDSIVVLSEAKSNKLLQIISDSLNFEKNKCELDRYFVHSGFVISTNDTLLGAVHMTYDLNCIEFTPDLYSSSSWTLTEKGKEAIIDLINDIEKQRKPNNVYGK